MNGLRLLGSVLWRSARERRTPAAVMRELLDQLAADLEDLPRDLAIGVLPVKPGDVIVATIRDDVDDPEALAAGLQEDFPGNPIVLLAEGTTLETLSWEQLDDLYRQRPPASAA